MKKTVSILTLLVLILIVPFATDAQSNLKIRLSGNTTSFLGEPNGDEVLHPDYETYNNDLTNNDGNPFSDFTNQGKLGFEAELMMALSEKVWLGFEVGSSNFKGYNYNTPKYNLFGTDYPQTALRELQTTQWIPLNFQELDSLEYESSLINLLVNMRFYLSSGRFRPFVKLHSGVSFIATELKYYTYDGWPPSYLNIFINSVQIDPADYEFNGPTIYSRGTSTSPEGRWPALNIGAGLGFEYQINEKISLYAGYTYSMINSDILDGRPNFDYNDDVDSPDFGLLERFNTFGNTGRISFGLTYSIGEGVSIISGGSKGGKVGGSSGRQHPYLPFYEVKRR